MSPKEGSVIVVDDDIDMNIALERLLRAAGYHTKTYQSAEELLANIQVLQHSACMIFDVHLPGLSGFDLSRQLRLQGLTTPLIFITAYDDERVLEDAKDKAMGASACLTKPFQGKTLLSIMRDAMGMA